MNILNRMFGKTNNIDNTIKEITNSFNKAFFEYYGGQGATYDDNMRTYIEKGYNINPDVYAVVTQMCDKTKSVPYYVKRIKDAQSKKRYEAFEYMTKGDLSFGQHKKRKDLEKKAYEQEEVKFPLADPNPNQTWGDVISLTKLFLRMTGNVYWYTVAPKSGANAGEPKQVYVLPSHLIKIIIKDDAQDLILENPIKSYMLIEGNNFIEFDVDEIIHIKLPNPNYDLNGSQLYGMSPIRSLLRTLESSNDFMDLAVKNGKNGGVFGFLSGKDKTMTSEQATQLKETLMEMDRNAGRLSRIAGLSTPIEFTKLSLNTDELKPFEYLKYNQKQICNVLGWSDTLLNNDDGGKHDKQKEEAKRVIMNNIVPDLLIIQEALNKSFLPRFKSTQGCVIEWDYTELPEMQEDIKDLVEWYSKAPVTPNEIRVALKLETIDEDGMDTVWIDNGKKRIDDVGISNDEINRAFTNEI